MDNLRVFFKDNDVRIGEGKDFTVVPAIYYASLNDAFRNYFLTFRNNKDTFHLSLDFPSWSRKALAFNYIDHNNYVVLSILGFHRFIELLLKDILRRINPFLAVKLMEKEVFQFLDNNLNADDIKTIEYAETFKRFKQAFEYYSKDSEVYKEYLKDYEFLISAESMVALNAISEWRNRIMHNGFTLPNIFAFEYLISQLVIPVIIQVIAAENKYLKGYLPHYFKTVTGINIIDRIGRIKFDHTHFKTKVEHAQMCMLQLAHLKELGRACYNIFPTPERNVDGYDQCYQNPLERAERFAATERIRNDFYALKSCICCGVNSMVVYRKTLPEPFPELMSWLKCYNCDYSLKNNIGDPTLFGVSHDPVFAVK